MARGFTAPCQLVAAVCVFFMLLNATSMSAQKQRQRPPSKLVVYEHESRLDPRTGVSIAASPTKSGRSGKYNIEFSDLEFGLTLVFSDVLRDGVSNSSTKLGRVVGQVTFADNLGQFDDCVLQFDTPSFAGTLLVVGGVNPAGNGKVMVTGGTGDFRFARGHGTLFTLSNLPAAAIYRYTLHITYD